MKNINIKDNNSKLDTNASLLASKAKEILDTIFTIKNVFNDSFHQIEGEVVSQLQKVSSLTDMKKNYIKVGLEGFLSMENLTERMIPEVDRKYIDFDILARFESKRSQTNETFNSLRIAVVPNKQNSNVIQTLVNTFNALQLKNIESVINKKPILENINIDLANKVKGNSWIKKFTKEGWKVVNIEDDVNFNDEAIYKIDIVKISSHFKKDDIKKAEEAKKSLKGLKKYRLIKTKQIILDSNLHWDDEVSQSIDLTEHMYNTIYSYFIEQEKELEKRHQEMIKKAESETKKED